MTDSRITTWAQLAADPAWSEVLRFSFGSKKKPDSFYPQIRRVLGTIVHDVPDGRHLRVAVCELEDGSFYSLEMECRSQFNFSGGWIGSKTIDGLVEHLILCFEYLNRDQILACLDVTKGTV